jgi:hypothetical protein
MPATCDFPLRVARPRGGCAGGFFLLGVAKNLLVGHVVVKHGRTDMRRGSRFCALLGIATELFVAK